MLIGIMGKLGAGKTLTLSALAYYLGKQFKTNVYANYGLKDAQRLESLKEFWNIENGIVALDELWIDIDARNWKNNITLTRWALQTRKKGLIVMYTTQHIRQVDIRIRNVTDYLIYTEKQAGNFSIAILDYQYREIIKKAIIKNPEKIFKLYNTYEIIKPMKY